MSKGKTQNRQKDISRVVREQKRKSPYTTKEWVKIGKLVSAKGKIYKSSQTAKKYFEGV